LGIGERFVFLGERLIVKNLAHRFFDDAAQSLAFKDVTEFPHQYIAGNFAFAKAWYLNIFGIISQKPIVFRMDIVLSHSEG
jgi:hypothetical protein